MRELIFVFLLTVFHCSLCKNNAKSLTESMGQEMIEIPSPVRDLPIDLEEEPSAEADEDHAVTKTTLAAATKKEFRKLTMAAKDSSRKSQQTIQIDDTKPDEEEARIEKELAAIYKDNIDYKADSSEATGVGSSSTISDVKPVARLRSEFKFQPDLNDKDEVERFRTSVDNISCGKKTTGLSGSLIDSPNGGTRASVTGTLIVISAAFVAVSCL